METTIGNNAIWGRCKGQGIIKSLISVSKKAFRWSVTLEFFLSLLGTQLTTFLASSAVSCSWWLSSGQRNVGRRDVHYFQAWPVKLPVKSPLFSLPSSAAACRKCRRELQDPREEQPCVEGAWDHPWMPVWSAAPSPDPQRLCRRQVVSYSLP